LFDISVHVLCNGLRIQGIGVTGQEAAWTAGRTMAKPRIGPLAEGLAT